MERWFSVALYSRRESSDPSAPALFEETTYLIDAIDEEEAVRVAQELAKGAAVDYEAVTGESISWRPALGHSVFELIDPLKSGAQVFCRFINEGQYKALTSEHGVDI
ncbi:MAG TPA: DUF4288 domain-containing protein [Fimbriimonadaceae bacterium]|nr:DUF4288 domain-containing protein [Fimbriimonadaceae bacterium]